MVIRKRGKQLRTAHIKKKKTCDISCLGDSFQFSAGSKVVYFLRYKELTIPSAIFEFYFGECIKASHICSYQCSCNLEIYHHYSNNALLDWSTYYLQIT